MAFKTLDPGSKRGTCCCCLAASASSHSSFISSDFIRRERRSASLQLRTLAFAAWPQFSLLRPPLKFQKRTNFSQSRFLFLLSSFAYQLRAALMSNSSRQLCCCTFEYFRYLLGSCKRLKDTLSRKWVKTDQKGALPR